jgi:hypothetical protein
LGSYTQANPHLLSIRLGPQRATLALEPGETIPPATPDANTRQDVRRFIALYETIQNLLQASVGRQH